MYDGIVTLKQTRGHLSPCVVIMNVSPPSSFLVGRTSPSVALAIRPSSVLCLDICDRANHCTELEPEYAAAAKELEKDGLLLGKVNPL